MNKKKILIIVCAVVFLSGLSSSVLAKAGSGWINSVFCTENPNCNLVMDFEVRTKHPGRIVVDYWSSEVNGGAILRSKETQTVPNGSDNLATFQIARLRANTTYNFEVTALIVNPGDPEGGPKYQGTFTTGSLPEGLLEPDEGVTGRASYLTMFNYPVADCLISWHGAVMLDEEGHIVWYYQETEKNDDGTYVGNIFSLDWIGDGMFVYEGKKRGYGSGPCTGIIHNNQVVTLANSFTGEEISSPDICNYYNTGGVHHGVDYLNGDVYYIGLEFESNSGWIYESGGSFYTQYRSDAVYKWQPNIGFNTKLFGWFSSNILDVVNDLPNEVNTPITIYRWSPDCEAGFLDGWYLGRIWTNSLQKIPGDGWLFSCRHAGVIRLNEDLSIRWLLTSFNTACFSPSTASKILTVCGDDDWVSIYRPNGGPYWQHSASLLPNGNVLMYDNGNDIGVSRVVEYSIDEENMTATKVWQYVDQLFCSIMSSAVRLDNGNTLIANRTGRHIVEINPEGDELAKFDYQSLILPYIYLAIPVNSINGESYIESY